MRRFIPLLLLLLLVAGVQHTATARKKKKKHAHIQVEQVGGKTDTVTVYVTKKEERKLRKQEHRQKKLSRRERRRAEKAGSEYVYVQPVPVNTPFRYPPTVMKPRYRMDLLAQLYLDELVKQGEVTFKDKMPEKVIAGVCFYEGLSIAADSLKKAGYNIDVYVHDVSSAAESADSLVHKGALDSSDLIIGAMQARDIPEVAGFAQKKHINFVSALSSSDAGVTGNKYFTILPPTLKSHCDRITETVTHRFPGTKAVLLFSTRTEIDAETYRCFTGNDSHSVFSELACSTLPSRAELLSVIDTTRPAVVVVAINDPATADSVLKTIISLGAHIEVFGMPSWSSLDEVKPGKKFASLSINITSPFHIDVNSQLGKYVSRMYKTDYVGKANEYVYRGFETMFWYAHLLEQYGTMFNGSYPDNSAAPFTRFEIKQQRDNEGHIRYNENTHIFVTRYDNGSAVTE